MQIQEIFNNREIAIGIWGLLIIFAFAFTKAARDFIKTVISILFCKKFIVFYIVFLSFLFFVIEFLKWTTFWDVGLLKDTIFWVVFVELPLFVKAIQEANDTRFFKNLLKENLKFIVIFEFLIDFWTFSLGIELIIVPISIIVAILSAIASRDKAHKPAKQFFNTLLTIWGIVLIVNAIYNTIYLPEKIFTLDNLKSIVLPIILLILNLPVVYGLSLYSGYEQLFIRVKDKANQKSKMKLQLLLFAGADLYKVTAIRKNISKTILNSLTVDDLRRNLSELEKQLSLQIGDNYMKRSNFYYYSCVIAALVSLIGLIFSNSTITLKELITFNFAVDMARLREILTYIFSFSFVLSIAMLFYAIGFKKKKYEEISQIKKYALHDFLFALEKQKNQLKEYPPLEDPISIYVDYMIIANSLKLACEKVVDVYGNLLTAWERESISALQSSATALTINVTVHGIDLNECDVNSFCNFYKDKVKSSQYNDNFNSFTSMIKNDIEKYSKRIEDTYADFKNYY